MICDLHETEGSNSHRQWVWCYHPSGSGIAQLPGPLLRHLYPFKVNGEVWIDQDWHSCQVHPQLVKGLLTGLVPVKGSILASEGKQGVSND